MKNKTKKLVVALLSASCVATATCAFVPMLPSVFGGNVATVAARAEEVSTYEALTAALANGGDVKLTSDVTGNVTVASGVKVNLDLGGCTLYGQIVNEGELTLSNGNVECSDKTLNNGVAILNSGTVISSANLAGALQCIRTTGGSVTVNGGGLQTTGSGTCSIFRVKGGTVTVNDGDFKAYPDNTDGNLISSTDAGTLVTINGGNFNYFSAAYEDNAPFLETNASETVQIKGGTYNFYKGDGESAGLFNCVNSRVVDGYQDKVTFAVDTASELKYFLNNGTYKTQLADDIALTETVTIAAGVTATFDLNGYTLSGGLANENDTSKHIYALDNSGTLTLMDTSEDKTGTIEARGNYNRGKITVESGKYVGLDSNGGAPIFNYSEAIINGGTFEGNAYTLNNNVEGSKMTLVNATVKGTGGIYNNGANLTIKGGTYEATGTGNHGLYLYNSTVTIEGGTFHHSGTTSNVYPAGDTELTIKGGEFTVKDGYYLIDATGAPTLTIENGNFAGMARFNASLATTIKGGTFDFYSGTILSTSASMSITGGTFTSNTSRTFAGKYVADGYKINADGVVVEKSALGAVGIIRNIATTNATGEARYQAVFLCAIDALTYKSVGFEVTVGDKTRTIETGTVYTGFIAAGEEYTPADFGEECNYIFACAINFPTELAEETVTVRAFYVAQDGTYTYGETKSWDYIYKNV